MENWTCMCLKSRIDGAPTAISCVEHRLYILTSSGRRDGGGNFHSGLVQGGVWASHDLHPVQNGRRAKGAHHLG